MGIEEIEKLVNPIFEKYKHVSSIYKKETINDILKTIDWLKQKSIVFEQDQLIDEIDKAIVSHQKTFNTGISPTVNWIPLGDITGLEQKERYLLESESNIKILRKLKTELQATLNKPKNLILDKNSKKFSIPVIARYLQYISTK